MSDQQKGNGFALDEDVKAEIEKASAESDLMGSWVTDEQGGDKLPLVEGWMPDNDEWQGKTVVNDREARLFALARALPYAYRDEFQEMDGDMNGFVTTLFRNLEMYLTSRDGVAREQQKSVLMAMFGGKPDDDAAQNFMKGMFAQAGEGDD
jgi:hypothetical protein